MESKININDQELSLQASLIQVVVTSYFQNHLFEMINIMKINKELYDIFNLNLGFTIEIQSISYTENGINGILSYWFGDTQHLVEFNFMTKLTITEK